MEITYVIKRDFATRSFHLEKITDAILKAMTAVDHGGLLDAKKISGNVYTELLTRKQLDESYIPTVEQVQDVVESKLMQSEFYDVAKAYILYRNEQAKKRKTNIFE